MLLVHHILISLNVIIFFLFDYCCGELSHLTNNCTIGPNFWCLNDKTELLCDIYNKPLGLCGNTSKHCQIATGFLFV